MAWLKESHVELDELENAAAEKKKKDKKPRDRASAN